jgi:CHAT domain-containing protein
VTATWEAPAELPRTERRSPSADTLLARAESRAREARQRGLREGNSGHPAAGARHVRTGLRQLGWLETGNGTDAQHVHQAHHALAARLLMLLAIWECEQGRTEYGLTLLDRAENLVAAEDRGVLLGHRGLLCLRTGRAGDALRMFDDAIVLLAANPAETVNLAGALLNRGFEYLNVGDVRRARPDLEWCQRVATDAGDEIIAAKALHNLGCCDLLAGDIPAALKLFGAAADAYRLHVPGFLPVLATDRARALLAAGLVGDAAIELDSAMAAFRQQRLDQDLAEAELARSQAALAAGQLAAARRWAKAAEQRFHRRGNAAWACLAALARLSARSMSPGPRLPIAAHALVLAQRLRSCGLSDEADLAELLAARALIAAGDTGEARRRITAVRGHGPAVRLDISLLRRLARAELAELEGQSGKALAELRAGLAMVQDRRGRLGSLDLQTGTAALGADLAAAGLRLALDRGAAPLAFAWLERSRAQAFRVRPVRPPTDPQVAAVLAELRQLAYLIRTGELNGTREPATIARHAKLQRQIREYSWQASGLGGGIAQASLSEVAAALQETGQSLVSLLAQHGRILAVVVRRGSARLAWLGDFDAAAEAASRLSADLDTLAGRRLPARLEAVVRESIRHQTQTLADEIITPLRSSLGDDSLVIVPTGTLASIPWSVLPDLRGRPITVCPSASVWLAARHRGLTPAGLAGGQPLLVAGPDLEQAAREVTQIATFYPGCRPLLADKASVSATLRALSGVPLAHLAAHGHHDRENVLFSRLDLADGPLMAYDIQQLAAAPRHIVLSSCDVGRTVVRPGDEILGFTAALLYIGAATVISSVTRVADDATVGVMTAYHRLLTAGAPPAAALAEAARTEQFSPFVCFGSG